MRPQAEQGPAYRPRLQRRLLLAFSGFAALLAALLGGLAMVFVYAVEDAFFTSTLKSEAERQRAHHAGSGSYTAPALPFVRLVPRGEGLPSDLASQYTRYPQRQEFDGDQGRHYHLRRIDADGTLLVAEVGSQLVVRPLRNELLAWLLAAAGGLMVLALLVARWLARRISAPLAMLAGRVAASTPDALPEDLAQGLEHDEVGQLAHYLDALHARTRELIAREQAFTADASHELRTPLAVIGIAADRLHQQAAAEQQAVVRSIQLAVAQLQQTVELMLALAREDPGDRAHTPEQPLLPMLERVVLAHGPLLDREGMQVELDVPAGLTRPWSPALTQLLVGNLLANAIAHRRTPRIRIEADAHALRVLNESLQPPQELLLDDAAGRVRGVKGAGSAGSGWGLEILRRLARRHLLAVTLSHRDGQTVATLSPARDAAAGAPAVRAG